MLAIQVLVIVLPFIIGVLSVLSAYHGFSRFFWFIFPPAKHYMHTIEGVKKIEAIGYTPGNFWRGTLEKKEKGFKEIIGILHENRILDKGEDVDKIVLLEKRVSENMESGSVRLTPPLARHLAVEKDAKLAIKKSEQFDPTKITRDIMDKARDTFQKRLAYSVLITLSLWLGLQSYLLYLYYSQNGL